MRAEQRTFTAELLAWGSLLLALGFLVVPILMGEPRHMSNPICENGFIVFGFACCAFFLVVFVNPDK
jgi:hypothetical protein